MCNHLYFMDYISLNAACSFSYFQTLMAAHTVCEMIAHSFPAILHVGVSIINENTDGVLSKKQECFLHFYHPALSFTHTQAESVGIH